MFFTCRRDDKLEEMKKLKKSTSFPESIMADWKNRRRSLVPSCKLTTENASNPWQPHTPHERGSNSLPKTVCVINSHTAQTVTNTIPARKCWGYWKPRLTLPLTKSGSSEESRLIPLLTGAFRLNPIREPEPTSFLVPKFTKLSRASKTWAEK